MYLYIHRVQDTLVKKEYNSAMYMLSLVLIRFPYHCL